jgi:predicted dehydrogenase
MDPVVGGGAPFDLLIHDYDLMNWYVGAPEGVVARGQRRPNRAYEAMAAVFTYPDGAIVTVEGGFVLRPGGGLRAQMRIVGDRGHLQVDSADPEKPIRVFPENEPEERIGIPEDRDVFSGIAGEWVEFLDTIAGRPHNRLRVEDARLAVECAALAVRSADEGREMQFG